MGFRMRQQRFQLYDPFGAIEVTANDRNDTKRPDQIRVHLAHIQKLFLSGDFNVLIFIQDTNPPSATTMSRLRDQISTGSNKPRKAAGFELAPRTERR